jgi:hypothetical protein
MLPMRQPRSMTAAPSATPKSPPTAQFRGVVDITREIVLSAITRTNASALYATGREPMSWKHASQAFSSAVKHADS